MIAGLTNGRRRLLENRDSWQAICADPSLIPNAIEEILRFDSSVVHWRRKTTQPVVASGAVGAAGGTHHFEELTAAAPGLTIVANQELDFPPIIGFRGPRKLEVSWD